MAYYLMQDNRRRMPSSAYLRAELSEASDAAHSYPSGAPRVFSLEAGSWGLIEVMGQLGYKRVSWALRRPATPRPTALARPVSLAWRQDFWIY